jgi:hypothetical protein
MIQFGLEALGDLYYATEAPQDGTWELTQTGDARARTEKSTDPFNQ